MFLPERMSKNQQTYKYYRQAAGLPPVQPPQIVTADDNPNKDVTRLRRVVMFGGAALVGLLLLLSFEFKR